MQQFLTWFTNQPHRYKIFIAGNHDMTLDPQCQRGRSTISQDQQLLNSQRCRELVKSTTGAVYLQDTSTSIGDITFYGTPWQPAFWGAFNLPRRGAALQEKWDAIPADVDVLLTHTPPHGVLDYVPSAGGHVGCELLRSAVEARVRPRMHIFGHIHECGGQTCHHEFNDGDADWTRRDEGNTSCTGGNSGSGNAFAVTNIASTSSGAGAGAGAGAGDSSGVASHTPPRTSCLFVNAASCPVHVAGPLHLPVVVFLPFDKSLPASVIED